MKVGIYTPYLDTLGGGERYVLTTANFFLKRGDLVDIFWDGDADLEKIKQRFGVDLTGINFVPDIFKATHAAVKRLWITAGYDLMFYLSDGSVPSSLARKNILHFQVPFNYKNQVNFVNKLKFTRINEVICNSQFTKKFIDRTYSLNSKVLYPPIDLENFVSGKKENLILSVGRFFSPSHPKKHEVMVNNFKKISKKIPGWKLVLIGGITLESEDRVKELRELSRGYPIQIIPDGSFKELCEHYAKAKIYWHAAGFGEDLEKDPQCAEHFGMTTVESMSAGCVPVVFAGGGQVEIVQDNKNGFLWNTENELVEKTINLINTPELLNNISKQSTMSSKKYGKESFYEKLQEIV